MQSTYGLPGLQFWEDPDREHGPAFIVEVQSAPPRRVVKTAGILTAFEDIASGGLPALKAFIRRYGPLPLCPKHFKPLLHPTPQPGSLTDRPCIGLPRLHPLAVYEDLAAKVRAARLVGVALRDFEAMRGATNWTAFVPVRALGVHMATLRGPLLTERQRRRRWRLFQELKASRKPQDFLRIHEEIMQLQEPEGRIDSAAGARRLVVEHVNYWLEHSAERPLLVWPGGGEPDIRRITLGMDVAWNMPAWNAIAHRLASAVMGRDVTPSRACMASGCPNLVSQGTGRGRPALYCESCRKAKVPAAIRSLDYRRRKRERKAAN
jgi:hypothetical protein